MTWCGGWASHPQRGRAPQGAGEAFMDISRNQQCRIASNPDKVCFQLFRGILPDNARRPALAGTGLAKVIFHR